MTEQILKLAEEKMQNALDCEKLLDYWGAGFAFEQALNEYNLLSGNKEKKAECKQKIRAMNLKRAETFKRATVQVPISEEGRRQIDSVLNGISSSKEISVVLINIASSHDLSPSYVEIIKGANETKPVTMPLVNLSTQDDRGNLIKDGNSADDVWRSQYYSIQQGMILDLYLTPIFQELLKRKNAKVEIIDFIKGKELFSTDFLKFIENALDRVFSGDFISALHILVPRLERLFLDLTQLVGNSADVLASRKQQGASSKIWTQEKTLGEDLLKDEEVRKLWGVDLCEQLSFVFYSQLGYKLRHDIAHGYARLGQFNFSNTALVLYFYIVLIVRIKKAN